MTETLTPVGVYPICNTGGLVIHAIDYFDEKVLVGVNDDLPGWYNMGVDEVDDELELGFYYGEWFIPFSAVERIW